MLKKIKRVSGKIITKLTQPNARPGAHDFALAVPFAHIPSLRKPVRIAVVCHLYYTDLAPEMHRCIENIPGAVDVFISTDTPAKSEQIRQAFCGRNRGTTEVRIVANRGRDIAPKLIYFKDVYQAGYDLILFLHSKKTEFASIGEAWRTTLLQNLAGSPETVGSIMSLFEDFPDIGMVISQHFEPVRAYIDWGSNFSLGRGLARRMGFHIHARRPFDFPSGSMFWARPSALKALLDLNLSVTEFPEEAGQIDGTIAHAIERMLLYVCERSGYAWVKVADPRMFENRATIISVQSKEELAAFMRARKIALLPAKSRLRHE